jgi:hypothetical protein
VQARVRLYEPYNFVPSYAFPSEALNGGDYSISYFHEAYDPRRSMFRNGNFSDRRCAWWMRPPAA